MSFVIGLQEPVSLYRSTNKVLDEIVFFQCYMCDYSLDS